MDIRKVFKTGNNYVISIPVDQEITLEFTKLVDDFMNESGEALKGLSKR
ncbi:hypothetical protein [Effusibacillus consociatus]|uniref:AbrB family transcriptional regulator n=1 Tax=Effusibacillus consociatus TaxID=1117041 RepID=A0ABV9PWZ7_9BACL